MWQTQLFCNVTGNPKPKITWFFYKDGKTIQVNKEGSGLQGDPDKCKRRTDDYYFLQSNDPKNLVICNPKKQHTGEYKCHAINSIDEKEESVFINVQSEYSAITNCNSNLVKHSPQERNVKFLIDNLVSIFRSNSRLSGFKMRLNAKLVFASQMMELNPPCNLHWYTCILYLVCEYVWIGY